MRSPSPGLANTSEDFPEPWRTAKDLVAWHGADAERQVLRMAALLTAEGNELGAKRLFEVFLAIGEIQRLARRCSERLH